MNREHELKTWPSFFTAILQGEKTFEIRENDRDYAVGDTLHLREFEPEKYGVLGYTGRNLKCDVAYVLYGGRFGIAATHCVMGIRNILELPYLP